MFVGLQCQAQPGVVVGSADFVCRSTSETSSRVVDTPNCSMFTTPHVVQALITVGICIAGAGVLAGVSLIIRHDLV